MCRYATDIPNTNSELWSSCQLNSTNLNRKLTTNRKLNYTQKEPDNNQPMPPTRPSTQS